jgi:hypothetical protein
MDASEDFLTFEELYQNLKRKAEGLVSSFTGLAGIVGNRQSLTEARSVRLLTVLGMAFLPLSFTSGLFSMTAQYLPGASKFWVYLAIAIPLLLVIFAVPSLLRLGYEASDDEDQLKTWIKTFRGRVRSRVAGSITLPRSKVWTISTPKRDAEQS